MSEQELKDLKNKVTYAVNQFLAEVPNLLKLDVHEQSISHRIAVYLEPLFKGWNVDCEYNKHLESSKKMDLSEINPDDHKSCGCEVCKKNIDGEDIKLENRLFRPDILVHQRGTDEGNLIAIELKKEKECFFDQAKLNALTSLDDDYRYALGVNIYFIDGEPQFKFITRH